ncbi:hypothetical protein BACFRA24663_20905 [Bacteroides fragilis]
MRIMRYDSEVSSDVIKCHQMSTLSNYKFAIKTMFIPNKFDNVSKDMKTW